MMKIGCLDYTFNYLPGNLKLYRVCRNFFPSLSKLGMLKRHYYLIPAARLIKSLDFESIQVMCSNPGQMPVSAKVLSDLMKDIGIELASIGAYGVSDIKKYQAILDYANGANVGMVCAQSGNRSMNDIISDFSVIADYAKSIGLTLAMENTPCSAVRTELELRHLCKKISSLRVNLDPANLNLVKRNVPDAVRTLGKKIVHIHVKDSVLSDDKFYFPVLGKGTVPWKECIQSLEKIGYNGHLIMEYEGNENPLKAVKESKVFLASLLRSDTSF